MGRLRRVSKTVDKPIIKKETNSNINAYRATRLWNQVVNGFKRFMPLKSHRVNFQSYDSCFKKEDGEKWLVEFISQTELLKPITRQNAAILLSKFVDMNIIEQVCCSKSWLRSPTILYRFSSDVRVRVEKLRTLRYFSRTPMKGTPEVELKCSTPKAPRKKAPLAPPTPHHVAGKENLLIYPNSPRVTKNTNQLICTPCKTRQSLKRDPVFSSTPKDKETLPSSNSPYLRALQSIKRSQNAARKMSGRTVKRIGGNKGPLKKDLLEKKKKNSVIEFIIDEFDELIAAIDKTIKT